MARTHATRGVLSRDVFPGARFLAVHTATQLNPRTLLAYEAEVRSVLGHHAMKLPEGHSRHAPAALLLSSPPLSCPRDSQHWSMNLMLKFESGTAPAPSGRRSLSSEPFHRRLVLLSERVLRMQPQDSAEQ